MQVSLNGKTCLFLCPGLTKHSSTDLNPLRITSGLRAVNPIIEDLEGD